MSSARRWRAEFRVVVGMKLSEHINRCSFKWQFWTWCKYFHGPASPGDGFYKAKYLSMFPRAKGSISVTCVTHHGSATINYLQTNFVAFLCKRL